MPEKEQPYDEAALQAQLDNAYIQEVLQGAQLAARQLISEVACKIVDALNECPYLS